MSALVGPARGSEIARVIRDLVAGIEAVPATTLADHVDRAVLRAYCAEGDIVPDDDGACTAALGEAIAMFTRSPSTPGVFAGLAAVGWAVAHLAGEDGERVCAKIDATLAAELPRLAHYDLVAGVVGIGVYALERGDAGKQLATSVLDELERRARPRPGGVLWHTAPELLPPWQLATDPQGLWNLGLAHGAPGVIALLARFVVSEIEVVRSRELIRRAVGAVFAVSPPTDRGRFGSWQRGGELDETGALTGKSPRLAWCYNDLGVSLALYAAGEATADAALRADALAIAERCALVRGSDAHVKDAGLCHGAFGAMHLFSRLFRATGNTVFVTAAEHWLEQGLALRNEHPIAGFPARSDEGERVEYFPDASIVSGATGSALALHAAITGIDPAWDRRLLVDI